MLRGAAHALAPLLGVEHEGVRLAAAEALSRVIAACLNSAAVAAAVAHRDGSGQGLVRSRVHAAAAPAASVVAAVAGVLGAQHRSAWPAALPGMLLAGSIIQGLGCLDFLPYMGFGTLATPCELPA